MGYHRAGYDVVGVDINPQPDYPFKFIQTDALEFLKSCDTREFDAIHASPPCQDHCNLTAQWRAAGRDDDHIDMIEDTRQLLVKTGLPYIIENVPTAPLLWPTVMLCGEMFGPG